MMNACIEIVHYGRLMMRPIQLYILVHWRPRSRDLEARIPLDDNVRSHSKWWMNRENIAQGSPLQEPDPQETMFTDASDSGWGGFLESGGQIPRARGSLQDMPVFRETSEKQTCPSPIRQCDRSSIHEQAG